MYSVGNSSSNALTTRTDVGMALSRAYPVMQPPHQLQSTQKYAFDCKTHACKLLGGLSLTASGLSLQATETSLTTISGALSNLSSRVRSYRVHKVRKGVNRHEDRTISIPPLNKTTYKCHHHLAIPVAKVPASHHCCAASLQTQR